MGYTINDIDKIIEFKSWSDKKKIDELLRLDCSQYTNLGLESSKSQREEVKKNSRKIYKLIKRVDKELGDKFLRVMD
tara:strand:+ start:498 stop:728 length:231 start_codon:yes stop_codon:yes gene_type:complete